MHFHPTSQIIDCCIRSLHTLYAEKELSVKGEVICQMITFDDVTYLGWQRSRDKHRSGSAPFMVCEISGQDTKAYVHRLHHDLESALLICVTRVGLHS